MFTKHNTNSILSARGTLNKRKYTLDVLIVEEWDRHQFALLKCFIFLFFKGQKTHLFHFLLYTHEYK